MSSSDIIIMLSGLVGGLAFFLYGMNVMSSGLEKAAGKRLEAALKSVTSNYWLSLLLGAGITAAMQSSSAMTVMLVGLANAGVIEASGTFGLVMGSNVGTTLTSWLLSLVGLDGDGNVWLTLLKPAVFAPFLSFGGIVLAFLSENKKHRNISAIFVGFNILVTGMNMISGAVGTIEEKGELGVFLTMFTNPIVTLLISTLFTGIIQSSAATVGIVQALALSGAVTYNMAVPLVLGANIGTCVTALISAIGLSSSAKRVALIHIKVNVIGAAVFMAGLGIFNLFFGAVVDKNVTMLGIALINTVFNISVAVILAPFKRWLAQ